MQSLRFFQLKVSDLSICEYKKILLISITSHQTTYSNHELLENCHGVMSLKPCPVTMETQK